jgi:DNA-binding NarL/FixJ family response regulator
VASRRHIRTVLVAQASVEADRLRHTLRQHGLEVSVVADEVGALEELDWTSVEAVVLMVKSVSPKVATDIRGLRSQVGDAPVIVRADVDNARAVRRVVESGGAGFVSSSSDDRSLAAAVAAATAGLITVPAWFRAHLSRPTFTTREKQILAMVVLGLSNPEIAAKLVVTESTVKSHLSAAFRKLGARNRSEAASLILDPNGSLGPGILTITEGPQGAEDLA